MNSNGYITAPISLKDDVYYVLGISPSGAYYDLAEACSSDKINAWAKYKPVRHDGYKTLTEANRLSVSYGIKMTDKTDIEGLYSQGEWVYEKPILGMHWMRLTDFSNEDGSRGYYHNAIAPLAVKYDSEDNWTNDVIEVNGKTDIVSSDSFGDHTENATLVVRVMWNSSVNTDTGAQHYNNEYCVTLDNIITDTGVIADYYPVVVLRYIPYDSVIENPQDAAYVYQVALMNYPISSMINNTGGVRYPMFDFGLIPDLADSRPGVEVELALGMVKLTDANAIFGANASDSKIVILKGNNGATAADPNFPVSDYIALNCGSINRKTYTLKNINPQHITPSYKMIVNYTRENRTDGVDGYKFTLTKITLENLNGGASRYVTLQSSFVGSNVQQDMPADGTDNIIGKLFVNSDKGSISEITPTQHYVFYTTAKSNVYGELSVNGTYAYGDWERPEGWLDDERTKKNVTAKLYIQNASSSGTFEGETYAA